jgi:3-oxoacyl-[acyl-carrier protein] reductase
MQTHKTFCPQRCFNLKENSMKNYLVVGAGSGIGLALTKLLSEKGHKVYAMTSQPENLGQLQNIELVQADFLSADWKGEDLPESLDGLVYCPGTINLKPIRGLKVDDFRHDFEVNVVGAVKVIQAALKALKKGGHASIVLFSTVAVAQGMPFHASIAAAKGAVEGLAKSLAAELAPTIRVNAIAPSLTETPLASRLLSSPEKMEASANRHPLKRIGQAGDIAHMAAFLLSDQTSWITGQVIGVDGGMAALKV